MITLADVHEAADSVKPYVRRTPQWTSTALSQRLNTNVHLKLELFQYSGSFKTRGAFHQMLSLGHQALRPGVVAVSGGNFARAVAYCSQILDVDAVVCMPANAPSGSIEATRGYGAQVELLPMPSAPLPAPMNGPRRDVKTSIPLTIGSKSPATAWPRLKLCRTARK